MPIPNRSAARAMLLWFWLALVCLGLAGCTLGMEPPSSGGSGGLPAGEDPAGETDQPIPTPTVEPSPTPVPRILTICIASEPETLFLYGGNSLAQNHILQAIYDGPIDTQNYGYQPVILDKLPDLGGGDAAVEAVPVEAGTRVVNADGELVRLASGEVVRPFGCDNPDCAIAWDGSPLEMAQLSATFR